MRILHYFPGFNRAGGLNRYAADLAAAQTGMGHEVFALCPQGTFFASTDAKIKKIKKVGNVSCFALLGGIPVPLLEGIHDPDMILKHPGVNEKDIERFCKELHPDILHIHTWMGFPPELLTALKRLNTKIVFTTHDYFGLCPKVNFIDFNGQLCRSPENAKCSQCNNHAPSVRELALRSNPLLLKMKKILRPAIRLLKRRKTVFATDFTVKNYESLQLYYCNLLKMCDIIHCNSEVTAQIYQSFVPGIVSQVVPITHAGITDSRSKKAVECKKIRMMFSGSDANYKGLPVLLETLDKLYRQGYRHWHLDIWGNSANVTQNNVRVRGSYPADKQKELFAAYDLLIVPSICFETFGFIVAEALSCGTPVLCSDTVGAKIMLNDRMVYHGKDELYAKLKWILDDPDVLNKENSAICSASAVKTIARHAKEIIELYEKC